MRKLIELDPVGLTRKRLPECDTRIGLFFGRTQFADVRHPSLLSGNFRSGVAGTPRQIGDANTAFEAHLPRKIHLPTLQVLDLAAATHEKRDLDHTRTNQHLIGIDSTRTATVNQKRLLQGPR
ncbi:hypothetical protein CCR81_01360 [Halorhodospira halophila]|nr:hypothetical protein [Halorhodospira halophila]